MGLAAYSQTFVLGSALLRPESPEGPQIEAES